MERSEKSSAQALICMDSSASSMHSGESYDGAGDESRWFSVISAAQAIHSLDQRRRPLMQPSLHRRKQLLHRFFAELHRSRR
jgi:hypothetical protein